LFYDNNLETNWHNYLASLTPSYLEVYYQKDYCYISYTENSSFKQDNIKKLLIDLIKESVEIEAIYQRVIMTNSYRSNSFITLKYPIDKSEKLETLNIKGSLYAQMAKGLVYYSGFTDFSEKKETRIIFPSKEIRSQVINKTIKGLSIFSKNGVDTYGTVNCKYPLSSFQVPLTEQATTKVTEIDNSKESDKLAILLTGKPGVGKTSWVNAFTKEVISPLGYLIINLDLESLTGFSMPPYVDKVCLVINDGDNLALSREQRSDGFTERVMSLLDGNQINCINPTDNYNTKLIVIITANTIERWDTAALRKGRIDLSYEFPEGVY
jgi:hypothetical protein